MALPKVTEPIAGQWPVSVAWRGWLETLDRRLTILANTEAPTVTFPDPPQLVQGEGINVYGGIGWGQTATLSLRLLPDSGVGAGLVKITRDAYGRLEGTEAATTTDLPEGTNLYYTDERAQDAVGLALAAGTQDGLTLTYTDASNKIDATNTDKGSVAVASHEGAPDPHPQYTTSTEAQAIADAKVQDAITDAVTDKAPSQNAVFDALALKAAIPKGYIDGLQLQWVSGTALTVSSGAAYVESAGNIVNAPSPIAKTGLVLTASTWYHVYLYLNAGTPDIEVVTTAPVAYSGTARSKSGDTTKRYVGSVKTDSSGSLFNFLQLGSRIIYRLSTGSAPHVVLSGGVATSQTAVSCSAVVPVTSQECQITIVNSANVNARLLESRGTYPVGGRIYGVQAGGYAIAQMPLNASQEFLYLLVSAPASGGLTAELTGYHYER